MLERDRLQRDRARQSRRKRERITQTEYDPKRRMLLRGLAGIGAVTIIGVGGKWLFDHLGAQSPYRNWERYRNSTLPRELVLAIGEDIKKTAEYTGFPQVGQLITTIQKDPESPKKIIPFIDGPIDVRLSDTARTERAVGLLHHNFEGVSIKVFIQDLRTGRTQETTLANPIRLKLTVYIDNSFYLAPDVVKKFILVKEFSHLLYTRQHAQVITEQVISRFSVRVPEGTNLPLLLWSNGVGGLSRPNLSLGDYFNNASLDYDGAGYWHNTPAFGKMKKLGHLSPKDVGVLATNNTIFNESLRVGLLVETSHGEFAWRSGIGPFSPQWLDIVRNII